MKKDIVLVEHPVSIELKKELRKDGFRIIDVKQIDNIDYKRVAKTIMKEEVVEDEPITEEVIEKLKEVVVEEEPITEEVLFEEQPAFDEVEENNINNIVTTSEEVSELDSLRDECTKKNIKFDGRSGVKKLKALLA